MGRVESTVPADLAALSGGSDGYALAGASAFSGKLFDLLPSCADPIGGSRSGELTEDLDDVRLPRNHARVFVARNVFLLRSRLRSGTRRFPSRRELHLRSRAARRR